MAHHVLLVHRSRSGGTDQLAQAFATGLASVAFDLEERVEVVRASPLEATARAVLEADAIVIATPEHFGSMAGATKHFFEEIWHACLDQTVGLPWQLLVKAGNDGTGTVVSVQKLATGLQWREFRPPLVVAGEVTARHVEAAAELGATLAVSLDAGIV
jgi:NAD(P)H-dependent FMN reductase